MIALLAFGLFITAVGAGVWMILRSDANTPDTIGSLFLLPLAGRLADVSRAFAGVQNAATNADAAMQAFATEWAAVASRSSEKGQRWHR